MKKLCATLIFVCLSAAGAGAPAQQGSAKKGSLPDEPPVQTLRKEPPGVICATIGRTRHADVKKDRTPKTAMPPQDGGADCLDKVLPKVPMA